METFEGDVVRQSNDILVNDDNDVVWVPTPLQQLKEKALYLHPAVK